MCKNVVSEFSETGMNRQIHLIALVLSLALADCVGATDTPESMELASRFRAAEAWMDQTARSKLTPGATAAVVFEQEMIWSHGFGFADLDTRRPATPETTFSICSISKLFTSIAVMDLVEQGKVDLDAELGVYLRAFDLPAQEGVIADPITIRGLLSHAAGLPREGNGAYWNSLDFPSEQALENTLDGLGRLYSPFTNYQYSNIGMALLGKVVTEVSGKSYSTYVQEEIFDPLNLVTMTTDMPDDGDASNFARGYYEFNEDGRREVVAPYQLHGLAPAGGFTASVVDLSKFAIWQFGLLEGDDEVVLERRTLQNMHKVHWYDPFDPESRIYGLGFSHSKLGETPVIGHGGYCIGQRADFAMDPKKKIAVTVMVNAENTSPSNIVAGIYALVSDAILAVRDSNSSDNEDRAEKVASLQALEGAYRWPKSPMGFYVIPRANGELDLIDLYASSPGDVAGTYRHLEGDRFRRVREEGDLGEVLIFERDDNGDVRSIYHEGYRYTRS